MNYFLLQVNLGTTPATYFGLTYIFFGLVYLVIMLAFLLKRIRRLEAISLALYLIQAVFAPIAMVLCGLILVFQGWRLDPILQFSQLLCLLLILYFVVKDFFVNVVSRER